MMRKIIISKIRMLNSSKGNSLAEFAVTIAVMATLAATAAPKMSELSEGTKAEKTFEEIDKIIKQAGNYYQKAADIEGRGRFPGQNKFYYAVPDFYNNSDLSTVGVANAMENKISHTQAIMNDLGLSEADGWRGGGTQQEIPWMSVFGWTEPWDDRPLEEGIPCEACMNSYIERSQDWHAPSIYEWYNESGELVEPGGGEWVERRPINDEWKELFGGEVLVSPYQDGHYAYTVVGGGGSGDDVFPPVIYVVDIENAVHYNNVLEP